MGTLAKVDIDNIDRLLDRVEEAPAGLIDTLIGTFYRSLVSIVTPSPDVYIATLPQYLPQVVEPLVSG